MKRWEVPVSTEIKSEISFQLKCVGCTDKAEMLFQGTSYCEKCLKERVRTGTA